MKKIYIAGKYDDTNVIDVLGNIRKGIELAVQVLKNGDIPFCPFLDFMFALVDKGYQLGIVDFRNYSMEWLKVCDEVWLLDNWRTSGGCKAEIKEAKELGIPVLESVEWFPKLHKEMSANFHKDWGTV